MQTHKTRNEAKKVETKRRNTFACTQKGETAVLERQWKERGWT